jgi:hypothetical protein
MSIRDRMRNVSISSVLLHGIAAPYTPPREPQEYIDARTEARRLCSNLGLDVTNQHWDTAGIGDFVRLAYAGGFQACEFRIGSADMADALAVAVGTPAAVVDRDTRAGMVAHIVCAVQRVLVYGVPTDKAPVPVAAGVPEAKGRAHSWHGGVA